MIFVTAGSDRGFPRLMLAVEQLKIRKVILEDVLLQVGGKAKFESKQCSVVRFLSPAKFEQRLREATVVICHGGAGTIIQALQARKIPVVVPRRGKYGEHIDDHQLEGARALAAAGRIILVTELNDLASAIEQARSRMIQLSPAPPTHMIELVSRAIEDLLACTGLDTPPGPG